MLRHKAMIQCARLAFGFAGIYDQDEAERIAEVPGAGRQASEISIPVELLERADAEAAKGVAAYQGFWAGVGPENRKLLAGGHESRKKAAVRADEARTVEAEPAAEGAAA